MASEGPRTLWLRRRATEAADAAGFSEETMISYPVPVRRGDPLAAAFFASAVVPTPDGSNFRVFAPMARFAIGWSDGSLLERDLREGVLPVDEDQPIGLTRTPEFAGQRFGPEEDRCAEFEGELYLLLDEAGPSWERGGDDPDLRARCLMTFRRLVPESNRSLYEELNPDFFKWLEVGPGATPVASAEPAPWSPTHLVPSEGMPAWGTPDPQATIIANLDPDLPLKVLETSGDWAHVEASNGWQGWVDGRLLRGG